MGFCFLFLVLGIWRHQAALLKIENSEIKNFIGKEITFVGLVDKEPSKREKTAKLEIKINKIFSETRPLEIPDRVLITVWEYPEYEYGDKLKIKGKLEKPQEYKVSIIKII